VPSRSLERIVDYKWEARLRSDELRRGSLRFTLRSKRRLVEAAGVEPASENIPLKPLHTYPGF